MFSSPYSTTPSARELPLHFKTTIIIPLNNTFDKLFSIGLYFTLGDWLQDFLTGKPQSVRRWNRTSASIDTNISTPQRYVLSPILYTLFSHNYVASHKDNVILKFVDKTTVIGCIPSVDVADNMTEVAILVT